MVDINNTYLDEKNKHIGSEILSTSSLYSPNSESVLKRIYVVIRPIEKTYHR